MVIIRLFTDEEIQCDICPGSQSYETQIQAQVEDGTPGQRTPIVLWAYPFFLTFQCPVNIFLFGSNSSMWGFVLWKLKEFVLRGLALPTRSVTLCF